MDLTIQGWPHPYTSTYLEKVAQLWNNNAPSRHAYFPWTGALLEELLTRNGKPVGGIVSAHTGNGELIGFTHINQVIEDGYPNAGCVEILLVDSAHRRKGIGTALLAAAVERVEQLRPRPIFIDALGAWPFGYVYNTLADGSERSGVFMNETPLYRLFRAAGFQPVRQSIVMRASLRCAEGKPFPSGSGFYIGKRTENTWLDRVFRGRELWDFDLARGDGRLLSRAIFGFMENESRYEGKAIFSVFGVNTPHDMQKKGYATANLSHMMMHVRDLGGEEMELHVYADNAPALALYIGLGFKPVAETVMMHKPLS